MANGLTTNDISRLLRLSPYTVRYYRVQLFEALCVRNAPQAVHRAHELGILG